MKWHEPKGARLLAFLENHVTVYEIILDGITVKSLNWTDPVSGGPF